jgi:hypothetical protein
VKIGPLPELVAPIDDAGPPQDEDGDDSDIPSSGVIKDVLGIDIPSADDEARFCVSDEDMSTKEDSTHLHAMGQTENILAYNDDGVAWEDAVQSDVDVDTSNA